jgi:ribosomal protein S18 acetylase RimI-like enzyme
MSTEFTSSIRQATKEDLQALCELFGQLDTFHVELLPSNFRAFIGPARPVEILEEKISGSNKAVFVAVSGAKVVGFVDVQKASNPPFPMFKPKDFALIDNLFVSPDHRGSGIARMLFEEAKAWARKQGLSELQLKVYDENKDAVRFYERQGMRRLSATFEIDL